MFRVLHISDLHFGPKYLPAVGEALLNAAAELACDVIVASGDFTQRAKRQQFAEARTFLARLPGVPKIVVPGNHDVPLYRVWERLFYPYRNYEQALGAAADAVHEIGPAMFVALNTTAPLRRTVNGQVRQRQIEFCHQAFRAAPRGIIKIVVAHHHFALAPDFVKDAPLPGAASALKQFAALGVDAILGGHLHRAYIGLADEVVDRARHRIVIVQSGTSTSSRGRGCETLKNTFNVVEFSDTDVFVTHYLYDENTRKFAPQLKQTFPRGPLADD